MRVAIDARLLAYQAAGISTYIRGILHGLRTAGHAADLVVLASRKDRSNDLDWTTRHVVWTPCHHRWERWALGAELAGLRVEVLHSPDFIPPARFGRRWARVITVHDLAFLRFPDLLTGDSQRYYRQIGGAVAEAERIIAVSETTRRDLLDLVAPGSAGQIFVVPEGVGPEFQPMDETSAARQVAERFGLRQPYFLFVGTREPRKNLPRLLRAFARFQDEVGRGRVELALAGSRGWRNDELEAAIARAGEAVRVLGRVDRRDLVSLYNGALALVLVSLYEGVGLPVLEAMACGRPTLVSDGGALPEIVGDAGLIVDAADDEAICAGLRRLWDDPELRRELATRGRQRAAQFDWTAAAQQTFAVYREAACAS